MSKPSKPLHRDPSFWIVVVVVVGGANLAQLYFAIPWIKGRIVAMQPAPKSAGLPDQGLQSFREPVNLDTSKKTFTWQTPRPQPQLLDSTPPQVVIIPSEYQPPSGGWSFPRGDKAMGIRVMPEVIVMAAYKWTSRSRMVWPADLPRPTPTFGDAPTTGYYDYIANLPTGALEALQEEARKKLGLVAERQTLQTNVLVLKVHHSDAPGLKPVAGFEPQPNPPQPGVMTFRSVASLASYLEAVLRMPVLDQTGLTGMFNIQFPSTTIRPPTRGQVAQGQPDGRLEQTKQAFLEQLGLELTETNAATEFLVVKKVN